jgi:hypothetical protein
MVRAPSSSDDNEAGADSGFQRDIVRGDELDKIAGFQDILGVEAYGMRVRPFDDPEIGQHLRRRIVLETDVD